MILGPNTDRVRSALTPLLLLISERMNDGERPWLAARASCLKAPHVLTDRVSTPCGEQQMHLPRLGRKSLEGRRNKKPEALSYESLPRLELTEEEEDGSCGCSRS